MRIRFSPAATLSAPTPPPPDTPKVDGLQIETYRIGVRDTSENRARFARLTADVLTPFLREHYAFDLAAKK